MAAARRSALFLVILAAVTAAAFSCSQKSPVEPTKLCTYTFTPAAAAIPSDGGSAAVQVSTDDICTWHFVADVLWIDVEGETARTGSGTLSYVVQPNLGETERSGMILIGNKPFIVTQAAKGPTCTYDVSPVDASFNPDGGDGIVHVTTAGSCAWSTSTAASWITITGGASGTGPGTVTYRVSTNRDTSARTGTLTVAGVDVTITQEPAEVTPPPPVNCTYSVAPVEFTLHWHGAVGDGAQVEVTTSAGCTWTVQPGASWLNVLTPASSSGPGVIRFTVPEYAVDDTRRAPIEVRWPTVTAGQNVWVTEEGCRYGLSTHQLTSGADGGRLQFTVLGDPISASCTIGCPWTAKSTVSWIHVLSAMPDRGDDEVFIQVDANTGGTQRTGVITVADTSVTVTQMP